MTKSWKHAIFDLDGTLLDSMGIWHKIDVEFLARRGFEVPDDYQQKIATMKAMDAAVYTINRFGFQDSPEELVKEWHGMAKKAYTDTLLLKPFAFEYVKSIVDQGGHAAVATSSERELVIPVLKRTGILPLLDCVVTAADVKRGKGFPDIYLYTAGRMGVHPDETAVFEDLPICVKAAKEGGFTSVGIYDEVNIKDWETILSTADYSIRSWEELL